MIAKFDPGPGRSRLGFEMAVRNSFDFLRELGFTCVRAEPTLVRFESADAFINVYHGRGSFELGVEIGRVEDAGSAYDLGDIARVTSMGAVDGIGGGQASTAATVKKLVARLAELTKRYGTPALRGDPDLFRKVHISSVEANNRYWHSFNLRQKREKANQKWMERNFGAVVEIYETMVGELTQLEIKRLSYARKHRGPM